MEPISGNESTPEQDQQGNADVAITYLARLGSSLPKLQAITPEKFSKVHAELMRTTARSIALTCLTPGGNLSDLEDSAYLQITSVQGIVRQKLEKVEKHAQKGINQVQDSIKKYADGSGQ
jgi:hypothetical protein